MTTLSFSVVFGFRLFRPAAARVAKLPTAFMYNQPTEISFNMLKQQSRSGSSAKESCCGAGSKSLIIWASILICALIFFLFMIPNSKASQNLSMVGVFEPDEAALFPVLERMLHPKADPLQSVKSFVAYDRYNKGFPFYAPSALVVWPFYQADGNTNFTLAFLALRQIISVLPSLIAVWLLVYMHTGYRSWYSLLVLVLLIAVPAQIQNGFWWHPDGLTLLGSTIVLYLVWKDGLSLGNYFRWAAIACGVLTATKSIGVFFAPLVLMVLIWAVASKKIPLKQAFNQAAIFLGLMILAYLLCSPFLLSSWGRRGFWNIMDSQINALKDGYDLYYPKGFLAVWPVVRDYYGSTLFLGASLFCAVIGLFVSKKRFLHALSLAWFLPLTLYLAFWIHFKFQYWLPVALPLIACTAILIPDPRQPKAKPLPLALSLLLALIIAVQLFLFIRQDSANISSYMHREQNSPTIQVYPQLERLLEPVSTLPINVYLDPRLYFPPSSPGTSRPASPCSAWSIYSREILP